MSNIECYGFAITLSSPETIASNPDIQYATTNLINDLLHLQTTVYWLSATHSFTSKQIGDETLENRTYPAGTFLVPFTGDESLDAHIIVIIYDYYDSHELYTDYPPLEILEIVEPMDLTEPFQLHEVDTAVYFSDGVTPRTLDWYVSTMHKAGFYEMEFYDDTEIIDSLDASTFNCFIWPGGSIPHDLESEMTLLTRTRKQQAIKKFVKEGGGFVGSCYGAVGASSGIRLLPFTFVKYFFPRLPSPYFLGLQDCLVAQALPSTINVTITDHNHPVVYGTPDTIHGASLLGGPVFTTIGPHSMALATVEEIDDSWFWYFLSERPILKIFLQRLMTRTVNTAIWTASTYSKGKVVTFGDHPEHGHINLQRIIHNSLFYVTSEECEQIMVERAYPLSFIETVGENSLNLLLDAEPLNTFSPLLTDINETVDALDEFIVEYQHVNILIEQLIEQDRMDPGFTYQIRRGGLWEFNISMGLVRSYLNNPLADKDAAAYLETLDLIYSALASYNISILDQITALKTDLDRRLDLITNDIPKIQENFTSLIFELEHYENSTDQNDEIVQLSQNIADLRSIEKYAPGMNFEIIQVMRTSWYLYAVSYTHLRAHET